MPFAEHFMTSGTVAVPASLPGTLTVNTGFVPTRVFITNETQFGQTGTGNENIQNLWWDSTNPTLTNMMFINAAGTALVPNQISSATLGISQFNSVLSSANAIAEGPKIAGTSYVKATGTFTITSTATLYPGATILMTSVATDKQLGGMLFTVNTVPSPTTFTIANFSTWLNTASFTGGAQAFNVQLVTVPALYYPSNSQIVFISAANPAVITTSTNMSLTVGQQVRIYVPKAFGMTQANFTTAIISAVSGNQITLGGLISLNSSAFTAFSWPLAAGVPFTPAYVIPIGAGPTVASGPPTVTYNVDVLDGATDSQGFQGFQIGAQILQTSAAGTVGVTASDSLSWTAWRGDV